MNIIEVVKKTIELTNYEKETLKAAVEIFCELYRNDEESRIWDKIEEEMDGCGGIQDFYDYAQIMNYLLILSNDNKLSI